MLEKVKKSYLYLKNPKKRPMLFLIALIVLGGFVNHYLLKIIEEKDGKFAFERLQIFFGNAWVPGLLILCGLLFTLFFAYRVQRKDKRDEDFWREALGFGMIYISFTILNAYIAFVVI